MGDSNKSSTSSGKQEETHNSDTLADETGNGGLGEHHQETHVREVPLHHQKQDSSRKNCGGWSPLIVVIGFLLLCTIIGLAVGLTRDSSDSSDGIDSSDGMDRDATATVNNPTGTWIPVGNPIVPEADIEQTDNLFFDFDTDGNHLVVADLSQDDLTAQVKWYAWSEQEKEWIHQTTLPLGDAHPQSRPIVKVAGDTLVVADAQTISAPENDKVNTAFHGIVRVYQLQDGNGQGEEPTLRVRHQATAGDLWGTTVALEDTAETLAVGTPLATDAETGIQTGVVHVYNLNSLTLEAVGRSLYGPHFLSTLGGGGLAMSGDGRVVAATATGQVFVWRWVNVTNDWSEPAALGPGIGNQVQLNQQGNILAATTYGDQVVVYHFVCQNAYNCGWTLEGSWPGTFVALHQDDKHMAVVRQENEDNIKVVQVFEYENDQWKPMGKTFPGVAAIWMEGEQILVQQKEGGIIQTWQWDGLFGKENTGKR